MRKALRAWLIGCGAGLASACMLASPGAAFAQPSKPATTTTSGKVDPAKAAKRDRIIFRSGNTVDGVVLSETATEIKFLLIFSETMRNETTYAKSDILEVKRDFFKPEPVDEKKDADKKDDAKNEKKDDDKGANGPVGTIDVNGKPIPEGNVKVYVVTFGGEFGRDVSQTPLQEVMNEIVAALPDVVIVRFDHQYSLHGEQSMDFMDDNAQQGFSMLGKARELDTLISNRVRHDPAFKGKTPRMVAWVNKAMGTAAFLPLTFPEVVFTNGGHMGGIGGLENLAARGDRVVQEKMRGIVMAQAIGLAEKGGHDGRIVKAMTRGEYILSYRMVGGKAEFLERMPENPDEILLKDDGRVNEARTDSLQDWIRMKGNDYLVLNAQSAFDIGFSKATADTVDELLYKLDITRNYSLVKNTSQNTFREWSRDVSKAEKELDRLLRAYRNVEVKAPGGYKERTQARGQQMTYLNQMRPLAKRFGEAINPQRMGDGDNIILQIDMVINRIKQAQQLDRPDGP